jgi:hypothetical protein
MTSVVVVASPVGPGIVTTPPHPPTQLVIVSVDVVSWVMILVVPFCWESDLSKIQSFGP